jgi:hypothetical protein
MSRHRYINLYVGYDLVPGGGRMGGEKEHAPYEEAKQVARRVEEVLKAAQGEGLLSKYKLMEVEPTDAHPHSPKAAAR